MLSDFKGKKVIIMGLGLYKEGSGSEAVKFFLRQRAAVTVTDLRSAKELEPAVREIVKYYSRLPKVHNPSQPPLTLRGGGRSVPHLKVRGGRGSYETRKLTLILGKHREEDFRSADLVFQNPSVPAESPYLRIAQKRKIPIVNDWSLFLSRHTPRIFVGVTGTRGKSTTTALIYEMMQKKHKKVWLAGNLGTSPLVFIDEYKGEPIVAELSSWLLHHFSGPKKSPNIAVVTNIMNDHMDKYRSMREYVADKENIFRFQRPRTVLLNRKGQSLGAHDTVVLNHDNPYTRAMARHARSRVIWFRSNPLAVSCKLSARLNGAHNVENVNAAVAVAQVLGVPRDTILAVLKTFRGLPGRLEFVRSVDGVRYYNDTTATTPEATIAALKTLSAGNSKFEIRNSKRIVLIAGGADKKLEYREMAKYVKKYCRAVVLLPGTATVKIRGQVSGVRCQVSEVRNMREAVKKANALAKEGDIVILSPAAASFGLFRNEFDRGEQFVAAVSRL